MAEILRSPKAKQDLIGIYTYIAQENPSAGRRMLETLEGTIQTLSENPFLGTAKLPNHPNVRGFPIENYLVLYAPLDDTQGIRLIRVIHGARDWQVFIERDIREAEDPTD